MMNSVSAQHYLALDVGARRIGVAYAESSIRLPIACDTLTVDGNELQRLGDIIDELHITHLVVGLPRNQSGEETAQSAISREFAETVKKKFRLPVFLQDESLTSVLAEDRLRASRKPYTKEDIDAAAAAIILCDYLGVPYAPTTIA